MVICEVSHYPFGTESSKRDVRLKIFYCLLSGPLAWGYMWKMGVIIFKDIEKGWTQDSYATACLTSSLECWISILTHLKLFPSPHFLPTISKIAFSIQLKGNSIYSSFLMLSLRVLIFLSISFPISNPSTQLFFSLSALLISSTLKILSKANYILSNPHLLTLLQATVTCMIVLWLFHLWLSSDFSDFAVVLLQSIYFPHKVPKNFNILMGFKSFQLFIVD